MVSLLFALCTSETWVGFGVNAEPGQPFDEWIINKKFSVSILIITGEYAGFDVNQPTSRTGGKGEAITQIRQALRQDTTITMIGDGATDLEACPPADHFVGYGGNVVREEVRARAQYYVVDFEQLYKDL